MSSSRRDFLRTLFGGGLALSVPLSAFKFLTPAEAKSIVNDTNLRWGFLVDTLKCVGCGLCVRACKIENEIPYEAMVTRTWVERYVITRNRETHIDSPKGALDGFTSQKIRDEEIKPEEIAKAFFVYSSHVPSRITSSVAISDGASVNWITHGAAAILAAASVTVRSATVLAVAVPTIAVAAPPKFVSAS